MLRSRWIFDAPRDLALFVATPLLILPLAFLIRSAGSDALFVLLVAAFGQVGHNLPGLIRAYGDRELFRRFRGRFILAPLLLGAACVLAAFHNLNVLVLTSVSWAIWHALMQTYGFVRIYASRNEDAKTAGSFDRRLDFAMCVLWFVGAILLNEQPRMLMLQRWYGSGGFPVPAALLDSIRVLWLSILVGVTALWLVRSIRNPARTRGEATRLGLMVTSIGFYWYAYAGASNMLVGAAMFEVFHDVQYLAIVWLFNRRRVEQRADVGRVFGFLFRRSGALIGCYVGLCFAFGSLKFLESSATGSLQNLLIAFLATSGLLHFYYDGFIWKIRETSTRESLDLNTECGSILNVPASRHLLKWAAFLLPVLWLASVEFQTRPDESTRWLRVTQSMPDSAAAHIEAAARFAAMDDLPKACLLLHKAVMLQPESVPVRLQLARLLHRRGRPGNALSQCQQILQQAPSHVETQLLTGRLLAESGQLAGAEYHIRKAIDHSPGSPAARASLGIVLAVQKRYEDAVREFEYALRLRDEPETHFNLANVLVELDRIPDARIHYEAAIRLRPSYRKAAAALARLKASPSPRALRNRDKRLR